MTLGDYTTQFLKERKNFEANMEEQKAKHKEEVQKKEQEIKELTAKYTAKKEELIEKLNIAKKSQSEKESKN
jgi:Skp family chaperone for outer membrane proteins